MNNSIGGFFVDLGLHTDKDSFDKGFKSVDNISNSINRLVGTIRNAAPIIMAGIAGTVETASLKTATSLGMSTKALDTWKTAAKTAGTNADSLVQGMVNLDNKLTGMKMGENLGEDFYKTMGTLHLDPLALMDMNAEDRNIAIFKAAQAMDDQKEAALLVSKVLGTAGKDFYTYLQASGKSVDALLYGSSKLVFTTDQSKRNAMGFNEQFQAVVSAGESMGMLFASEVGKALTPALENITTFFGDSNEEITAGIVGVTDSIGKVVGGIFDMLTDTENLEKLKNIIQGLGDAFGNVVKALTGKNNVSDAIGSLIDGLMKLTGSGLDTAVKLLTDIGNALAALLTGDWSKVGQQIKQMFTDLADGWKDMSNTLSDMTTGEAGKGGALLGQSSGFGNFVTQALHPVETVQANILFGELAKAQNAKSNKKIWKGSALTGYGLTGSYKPQDYLLNWSDLTKEQRDTLIKLRDDDIDIGQVYGNLINTKTIPRKVNDGIISPSGNITQVAPNDWVFAAKDLGKLASAFFPQSYNANSSSSFVINQTFNVSGSHDIPSTIRQQAYAGTQSAILQSVSDSSRRLQMMSGTY